MFLFVGGRRYKAVGFLLIHFGHIAGGNFLMTSRTIKGTVVEAKIKGPLKNSIIIHFDEVATPNLLIGGDVLFAMGAVNVQQTTAPYFSTVWIIKDLHIGPPKNILNDTSAFKYDT